MPPRRAPRNAAGLGKVIAAGCVAIRAAWGSELRANVDAGRETASAIRLDSDASVWLWFGGGIRVFDSPLSAKECIVRGRMFRNRRWLNCWLLSAVTFVGCATWDQSDSTDEFRLPAPKLSPDAVVVDVVFLRVPMADLVGVESMWSVVDEQAVPIETRRELAANGIRAGVLPDQLPDVIRDWIDQSTKRLEQDATERIGATGDTSLAPSQLQVRPGRRKELMLAQKRDGAMTLLAYEDGQLVGQTYRTPRLILSMTAIPFGDSSAQLQLTPEVHHGEMRNRVVGGDQAIGMTAQQDRKSWNNLKISANMTPGQYLVVTATEPMKGLGQVMFQNESLLAYPTRLVLLIRLSQTQLDSLFAPEQVKAAAHAADK